MKTININKSYILTVPRGLTKQEREKAEILFCQNCPKPDCEKGWCEELKKFRRNYSR